MRAKQAVAVLVVLTCHAAAVAQPIIVADSGDSAWMLTASALTLFTALPALALFYGGLVRARHLPAVLVHGFVGVCVASLIWAVAGYSLAFGDGTAWLGGIGNVGLANLADIRNDTTVSENIFVLFQMMLAAFSAALVASAIADRVRFGWAVAFTALWSLLVYVPIARWVWGGGWLAEQGTIDFAGGLVIHTSAGVAALVITLLVGKQKSVGNAAPNGPALTIVGAGLLWIGSFGVVGGSSLVAGSDAASALINVHLAASSAGLVWLLLERARTRKLTAIGFATGVVSGLAAIAPAAGFIGPIGAILLGSLAGVAVFAAVSVISDTLQISASHCAFAIHGVGGIVGTLILPLFVLPAFGGPGFDDGISVIGQFAAQALGVGLTVAWTGAMTAIVALMVAFVMPMQRPERANPEGDDIPSHSQGDGDQRLDFE